MIFDIYKLMSKLNCCGDGGGDGGGEGAGISGQGGAGMSADASSGNFGGAAQGGGQSGYDDPATAGKPGILGGGVKGGVAPTPSMDPSDFTGPMEGVVTTDMAKAALTELDERGKLQDNPAHTNALMDVISKNESFSNAAAFAKGFTGMPSMDIAGRKVSPLGSALSFVSGIPGIGKMAGTFGAAMSALGGDLVSPAESAEGISGPSTKKGILTAGDQEGMEIKTAPKVAKIESPKVQSPGGFTPAQIKNDVNVSMRGRYGLS